MVIRLSIQALVLLCVQLAGCSSDSTNNSEQPEQPEQIDDILDLSSPQIVRSLCGSLDVQQASVSTDVDSPTPIGIGSIGESSFSSTSENSENYWEFDLSRSHYNLIIDSDISSSNFAAAIKASIVDQSGVEQEILIKELTPRFRRIRSYAFFESTSDSKIILKIEPNTIFGDVSYQLAVLENGAAVPTPYLTNCPEVTQISLATTESFDIDPSAEKWFSIELDTGNYDVGVLATKLGSLLFAIQYDLSALSEFAQLETSSQLASVEVEDTSQLDALLTIENPGLIYLRFNNARFGPLNIEFSVTPK